MKLTYTDNIEYMSNQVGVSHHQARQTLKEIRKYLQRQITKGFDIHIDGLCKIKYTITGVHVFKNGIITLTDIKEHTKTALDKYDEYTTGVLVDTWIKHLIQSIERGYSVSITGVATILLNQEGEQIMMSGRMSPQLKKPEFSDFVVLENGELVLKVFKREDLRLSMSLDEQLRLPARIRTGDTPSLNYLG